MIAALKVLTILATALFGVFGSLVNFRDLNGRITRFGWIGLVGVIAAGASAAALQVYSDLEQEKSTFAVLTEINRTLHPLPGLTVTVFLRPDWHKEGFNEYFSEIQAAFDHKTGFGNFPFQGRIQSALLNYTVCEVDAELLFYRVPIDPSHFEYKLADSGEDLRISFNNPCKYANWGLPAIATRVPNWDYDLRDGKLRRLDLEIRDQRIDSTSNQWRSNSKISSLQDLLGSQLIVQLVASGYPVNAKLMDAKLTHEQLFDYRRSVHLAELLIRLPNGVVMSFDADNFVQFSGADGFPAYSFTFPGTMEKLVKATRYDQFKKLNRE
jgi:hypothetical protein